MKNNIRSIPPARFAALLLWSALFLSLLMFPLSNSLAQVWEEVYSTDFSTDPAWTTNAPQNFYWNEAAGNYYFKRQNGSEQYSYKAIPYDPSRAYCLEFDACLTRCDWAADLFLSLIDPDMHIGSATTWQVSYHNADQGKTASLIYYDAQGGSYHPGGAQPAPFELNTWYHTVAVYDPAAGSLSLQVTKLSDDTLVGGQELTGVGSFAGVDRLSISAVGHTYASGAIAEGYIDNLVLKSWTAICEAPVVTAFAINGGAATTQSQTVTLNNTTANNPSHYMASESSDFSGAAWQTYSIAPQFSLSAGDGQKIVYFKTRNSTGESNHASDSIFLEQCAFPDMIAYWKFDEVSGNTAHDSAGDHHGTLMGGTGWSGDAIAGSALLLDGTGYVSVPNSADLFPSSGQLTIEVWVNFAFSRGYNYPQHYVVDCRDWTHGYGLNVDAELIQFWVDPGCLVCYLDDVDPRPLFEPGCWHHVAGVYDGTEFRLYLDSVRIASYPRVGSIAPSAGALLIGACSLWGGEGFVGKLDELAIYSRALTGDEVQQRFHTFVNQTPVADAGENIQVPSADQAYTLVVGLPTDPDGDALEYRWREGETILLDWTPVGPNGEAYLDLGSLPYFSIGNHTLTLEVREVGEGGPTASDDMVLTIQNSPPEAQPAPSYQVAEFGIDPIIVVTDVSDFDGDTLSYEWLKDSGVLDSGTATTIQGGDVVALPDLVVPAGDPRFLLGIHQIELKVSDGINDAVSAFVSVQVIDTTAPSLSPVPSVTILWPPNHKLVPVTIEANAFDNGGGGIDLEVEVQSSEPPDSDGDGNTIPDFYIDSVDDETGVIEVRLRSERSGKGDGRIYTISIVATDASGNQSVAVAEILAPHDKRKK